MFQMFPLEREFLLHFVLLDLNYELDTWLLEQRRKTRREISVRVRGDSMASLLSIHMQQYSTVSYDFIVTVGKDRDWIANNEEQIVRAGSLEWSTKVN